ncbi:MAG: family 43 glycosylhydrolase [Clostridia bacterium]|nr:family 43 glycosylhydrolase [Clostridia bacterium]
MMQLNEINIRDPFILPFDGRYYMYGTRAENTWIQEKRDSYGFDVYVSEDLENWSDAISIFEISKGFWGEYQFWAPEVHYYNGKFYLFATFSSDSRRRGTAILVSDTPDGKFKEHSKGAVTPEEWECLDGTFYCENGIPYMIFCHEWTQIHDGEVCAIQLTEDLKEPQGKPFTLWKASSAGAWIVPWDKINYVTDGPFVVCLDGELMCLWSSFGKDGYAEAISRSDNGTLRGNWIIDDKLLFEKNGGHGMVFETFDGELMFVYHSPNETPLERPCMRKITKEMLKRG